MTVVQSLRLLVVALLWPTALFSAARLWPDAFRHWPEVAELAVVALTLAGVLIAAGFSQWRISSGFLLVVLAWTGLRIEGMPLAAVLLPVLGLGLLPWLREGGVGGSPTMLTGAVIILVTALWLRGGAPARTVDQLLQYPLSLSGVSLTAATLVTGLVLAAALLRLLIRRQAPDLALGGAMAACFPLTWSPALDSGASAAAVGAVLALWTGLLMHAWRLAFLDELTALPNRRALENQLRAVPGRWCLAMLDVDHFKKFNDNWGHDVGDQVLRRVATTLMGVGGRGRAFRYGGEEFAVFFPHDDLERASQAIEDVRERVANTPFHVRGTRTDADDRGKRKAPATRRITLSAGLALADNGPVTGIFKRADQALYKAKARGRNRLVRAG